MSFASTRTFPFPRFLWTFHFRPKVRLRWLFALVALAALCGAVAYSWPRAVTPPRIANEEINFPLTPPSASGWGMENAFPHLKFFEPTSVNITPDGQRAIVLERRGTIQGFDNNPEAKAKRQLLDISRQVSRTSYEDDGALGLVLHPEFGESNSPNRDFLYLFYTADANGKRFDRLSRFTMSSNGESIDPRSELILIDQLDENLWHNGGGLTFGPDGFLYVGVGDEGVDADGLNNGQKINQDLFSGILRIDVDRRGGTISHKPPRQPKTGQTAHYFIPSDNPFVGVEGALEEFWSIGLRNPHRFSFDPVSQKLWVGDVGHLLREEINIASRGSNHGWSYAEGRLPFRESYLGGKKPSPYHGVETVPLFEYPHLNGNNCVIGGHVYRGSAYPELRGKYIYADNGSGRIFALAFEEKEVVANTQLAALPFNSKTGISSIDLDATGELLFVVVGAADRVSGTIHRLVRSDAKSDSSLPRRLSQTGIFSDLATLTPSPGFLPYDVNAPLWSDGAQKRRWILLPGDGTDPSPELDHIRFHQTSNWQFPDGTIFVKHFELPIDENDPSAIRRLETRVLVRDATGGVYGVTYKWNDEQTDAELLDGTQLEPIVVYTKDGGTREQTWQYPGRQTCLICHNDKAGGVLGVNARQLNGVYRYPSSGKVANQLSQWNRIGMFVDSHDELELLASPRLPSVHDSTASLETRVRSYLDVNCAACHRPGVARASFDVRFESGHQLQSLIGGKVNSLGALREAKIVTPGDPSRSMLIHRMLHKKNRMPDIGVLRRDHSAIGVLTEWIDSLDTEPFEMDSQTDDLGTKITVNCELHVAPSGVSSGP